MDFVRIDAGGVGCLERMDGTDWLWGSDYTSGDLYEAEELFRGGHPVRKNRLVFARWPERGSFAVDAAESLDSRAGDRLIFSQWYEDPDYREEVVVRKYPTGEVLERARGTLMTMPDGQKWLFTGEPAQ